MPEEQDNVMDIDAQIRQLEEERNALLDEKRRIEQRRTYEGTLYNGRFAGQLKELDSEIQEKNKRIARRQEYRLYTSLTEINFVSHQKGFSQIYRSRDTLHHMGAFILHGATESNPDYGYSMQGLVKSFVGSLYGWKIKVFDFGPPYKIYSVDDVWQKLAFHLGVDKKHYPDNLVEGIIDHLCKRLETEHIILHFGEINKMLSQHVELIIEDFWKKLVKHVQIQQQKHAQMQQHMLLSHRPWLFMFLVDYNGKKAELALPTINWPDTTWQPDMPIRLPMATNFTASDLTSYIDKLLYKMYQILPENFSSSSPEEQLQSVLKGSQNGNPDAVWEYIICELCQGYMEGALAWLKL